MTELYIVGTETRCCTDCGARIRNVPPDGTECIFCGGTFASKASDWETP